MTFYLLIGSEASNVIGRFVYRQIFSQLTHPSVNDADRL